MTQIQKQPDYCTCPDFGHYVINGDTMFCVRCNRIKPHGYTPNEFTYGPLPEKTIDPPTIDLLKLKDLEIEELKKEIVELKEQRRQLNAGMIHFSTLDKMPNLEILDREGVIRHVVSIGKNKVINL